MKHWIPLAGLSALVVVLSASTSYAQVQPAGLVRISDKAASGQQMQAEARQAGVPVSHVTVSAEGHCDANGVPVSGDCEECRGIPCFCPCLLGLFGHHCYGNNCDDDCYVDENGKLVCNDRNGFRHFCKKAACRYGYFRPQGNCGKGLAPFGKYTHVYSLNPDYFDGRDGQLYAAQGYGVNVSVPLAPTVGSVYNYGWGIPSSRQTFVRHRIPLEVQPMPTPIQAVAPVQTP